MSFNASFPRSTEQQDKSLIDHGSDSGEKKKVGDEAPPRDGLTLLSKALALLCFCGLAVSIFQVGCKFNVLGLGNSIHNPYQTSPTTSDVSMPKNLRDAADDDYGYETMVEVDWDENNTVTIEFCFYDDDLGNDRYGYRLPNVANTDENCGPAGLVIRMEPGKNYTLTLHNTAIDPARTDETGDVLSTNIHTHGLHISGDGHADDITRVVEHEQCIKYHWNIPSDHMGGTHWMHGHWDNNVEDQVLGGAYSMIIIEENDDLLSNVIEDADKDALKRWMENELLLVSAKGSPILGNGKEGTDTKLQMISGEWYHLRTLSIQKDAKRIEITFPDTDTCEVRPVAWDGVWTLQAPGPISEDNKFKPTGAGRLDVAIKCSGNGDIFFGGTRQSNKVASVEILSGTPSIAAPFLAGDCQWTPGRPHYLSDLRNEADPDKRTITLTGQKTINGQGDLTKLFDIDYDTVSEWTVNGASSHPFHLHVFHMQVQSGCSPHVDGEFYDTLNPSSTGCIVRFHIVDFSGRIVMHCHNIGHEDDGMIVWFNATNGPPVETSDDMNPYSCPPLHRN